MRRARTVLSSPGLGVGHRLLHGEVARRLPAAGVSPGGRSRLDVRARRTLHRAAIRLGLRSGGPGDGARALRCSRVAAEVVAADPPRDGGVRAGDLRDVARAKGLSAFVVAGTFADLFEQLGNGRPVPVGLAKPMTGGRARAHYEVVVAICDHRLLTLDPARGLSENSLEDFARESAPTGQVTLIVFRPGSVRTVKPPELVLRAHEDLLLWRRGGSCRHGSDRRSASTSPTKRRRLAAGALPSA